MNIAIIEDELITANDLKECIQSVRPNYRIVKLLASVSEALDYFKESPHVDLLFSDIQLGDGLSFDIFSQSDITAPVIFCTAYVDYALQAFNANGIAYLLKPFDKLTVLAALEKYERLLLPATNKLQPLFESLKRPAIESNARSLLVYEKDRIIPIPLEKIAILILQAGVVKLYTQEASMYRINQSLDDFEKHSNSSFFRVNRQCIVHRSTVKEVLQYENRKLLLQLTIPVKEEILVSKEKVPFFLSWLSQN